MANKRTFGWVQNPGDLSKLKKVVSVFLFDSKDNKWLRNEKLPLLLKYKLISSSDYNDFIKSLSSQSICIPYQILKGKGAKGKRSDALCTGIVQAIIDGQQNRTYIDDKGKSTTFKKPFVDDWSADGYLRWAISCGLLEYDEKSDSCYISELGKALALSTDGSKEEYDTLSIALLSYPPVCRILSLLKEKDEQTKFELGSQLGFKGELGFTSIPQDIYLCDFSEALTTAEKSAVRSNLEGDSDKYARGIASWCSQMNWVESSRKQVTGSYRRKQYSADLQAFSITRLGEKALIKAKGNSSNPKIPKNVLFQMLASNKTSGADYLRYLRSSIIKVLEPSPKSLGQLKEALKGYQLDIDEDTIIDNIQGLVSIGINITNNKDKYKLEDKIEKLYLPPRSSCVKDEVNDIVDRVRVKLKHVDHKYLILISLAYSNETERTKKNSDARDFEIQTAELFTKELGFNGIRLGESNKPDVLISFGANGTIIDNKSYKDGFNIPRATSDQMIRYINENNQRTTQLNPNEWWKNFDSSVLNYTFLFVTSFLKGSFKNQIEYISKATNGTRGAAINVENLLYISEDIKSGNIKQSDFYSEFKNDEIVYSI
ncbi:restriction endonuclease FokI C-terminal domain-containing protein [Streptococcus constellatus]|uniref:restriction endonuclease FokI C-terminal domain-containing protein n=1 Tax=Streptococcus constellatus TaxID=76860 RepID=UPI00066BF4AC|nr:restriction endonuclease FokI C-terminal domain-containing protein [Streptococcus constellatus]